jgi:two-component system response regulator ChvI
VVTAVSRLVFVVLSDETLRESVCRAIRLENHRAMAFGDAAAALDGASRGGPDVVIVEAALDGEGRLRQELRKRSPAMSTILITPRHDEGEAGGEGAAADDRLAMPFTIKEILARLKVLVRRAGLTANATHAWEDRPLTLGPLTVDPLRLSAQWSGHDLGLTVTEFFLLHSLVSRAGVVKTRDQLMQEAFPDRAVAADRTVEMHMKRIQEKFERLEPRFDALEGVHGAGYRYRTGRAVKKE